MDKAYLVRIQLRVLSGDFAGAIRAAIIDKHVLPVGVRLTQNALDALGKVIPSVVERRDNGDQGLGHSGFKRIRAGVCSLANCRSGTGSVWGHIRDLTTPADSGARHRENG